VERNLAEADRLMAAKAEEIGRISRDSARLNLLVVAGALVLGVVFTLFITGRIVRPVREMAGLLDRLTHESPSERIATHPGARDELDAMAESLNTMADHRANFMHWWMASMNEAVALRDLHEGASREVRGEAAEELRLAALDKVQQLNAIRGQLLRLADQIQDCAGRMRGGRHGVAAAEEAARLARAADTIRTLLTVVAEKAADRASAVAGEVGDRQGGAGSAGQAGEGR
jgi:methyl-accepting chemotaxis protein